VTLCKCAVVYPDTATRIHGSCAACKGRGVVETPVSRAQWDALFAAGWRVVEGRRGRVDMTHDRYRVARIETALWLMEHDRKAAKAAEVRR